MIKEIMYFERMRPINTNKTIELAKKRAEELGIKHIVVASLTGESALKVAKTFVKATNIVCVRFLPSLPKKLNYKDWVLKLLVAVLAYGTWIGL